MLATALSTSLLALTPLPDLSRYERAFETAKRLEIEGHTPDLVFMMEGRNSVSWQIVSFYRVDSKLTGNRWVVRRQREGDARWSDDPDTHPMPLAWSDSLSCPGVRATLEAVEDIQPTPLDVYRVGSEYGVDAPLFVGGARTLDYWAKGLPSSPVMSSDHLINSSAGSNINDSASRTNSTRASRMKIEYCLKRRYPAQ